MLSAEIYFKKFLAYEMGTISNSNLTPHNVYYESYRSLDSALLKFHEYRSKLFFVEIKLVRDWLGGLSL